MARSYVASEEVGKPDDMLQGLRGVGEAQWGGAKRGHVALEEVGKSNRRKFRQGLGIRWVE